MAPVEIERRVEQELADVRLQVGFRPTPCTRSKSTSYRAKIVHGVVRYACGLAMRAARRLAFVAGTRARCRHIVARHDGYACDIGQRIERLGVHWVVRRKRERH